MSRSRRATALLLLAAALPALGYVLPTSGILKRMGERRATLALSTLEVHGTLRADGPAADRLAAAGLPRGASGEVTAPARFLMRVPGRCRLELLLDGVPEAERPAVTVRGDALSGRGALDQLPSAVALVRSACALLATRPTGDASAAYAGALARRGVVLADAGLGRFDGRIAYVIGGRASDARPLLFVDKETFQPLRLVSREGAALADVRLLGWGSAAGGDWFPRAVEVHVDGAPALRLETDRATANPKLPGADP